MPKVLFADRSKRFAATLIAVFLEFTRCSEALIRLPVAMADAYPKVFVYGGSRTGWRDGLYIRSCLVAWVSRDPAPGSHTFFSDGPKHCSIAHFSQVRRITPTAPWLDACRTAKRRLPCCLVSRKTKSPARCARLLVAGAGFEPTTFGL